MPSTGQAVAGIVKQPPVRRVEAAEAGALAADAI